MKFFPYVLASFALCACVNAPEKHKVGVKDVYVVQKEMVSPLPPALPSEPK